jgi:hypothetical protein
MNKIQYLIIILGFIIGFCIVSLLTKTIQWELFAVMIMGYLWSQLSVKLSNKKIPSIHDLDKDGITTLRNMETGAFFILSVLSFAFLLVYKYVLHYQSISVDWLLLYAIIMIFLSWVLTATFVKKLAKKG